MPELTWEQKRIQRLEADLAVAAARIRKLEEQLALSQAGR
jgi:hypothetical protein